MNERMQDKEKDPVRRYTGVCAIAAGALLLLATVATAQPATTQPAGGKMHDQGIMPRGPGMQRMMEQHKQTLQSIDRTLDTIEQAQQSGDPSQIRQALQAAQDQLRQVRQQMSQRMQMMQQMHERMQDQGTGGQQQYTCPMHPEVRSDKPGTCPKCEMKLEPAPPSAATQPADHAGHHDSGSTPEP